jgi:hypothetical protein
MLQLTPVPDGRASLNDRPPAAPVPVFVMVTVNPIWSPALTLAASAVLVIVRAGSWTSALGWMLRSWFLLPDPSRPCVRMCHGAPLTWPAPSGSVGSFQ